MDRTSVRRPGVIVASNRAPLSAVRRGRHLRWKLGRGGLIRAVRPALDGRDRWVASSDPQAVAWATAPTLPGATPVTGVALEPTARRLADLVCNRWLWFSLHGTEPSAHASPGVLNDAWADGYRRANQAFAKALASEWRRRPAPVLVQDYHLFLTPGFLRELVPDADIALFCHTPFPAGGRLPGLPPAKVSEMAEGMLASDLIGFQSDRDRGAFVATCASILGTRSDGRTISWNGRTVRLGVFPASVDPGEIAAEVAKIDDSQLPFPGSDPVVTWAGRADPVKNALGAIRAFRMALAMRPDLVGRARLLIKTETTRDHLPEYETCLLDVQAEATELNARLATHDWVPVAIDMSPRRHRALEALCRADVLLVNPVADGMNLVVQEGAIAGRRDPAVVLSRMTGAYERFGDLTVPTDASDTADTARALLEALRIPEGERARRIAAMRDRIAERGPTLWLDEQIAALAGATGRREQVYVGA